MIKNESIKEEKVKQTNQNKKKKKGLACSND